MTRNKPSGLDTEQRRAKTLSEALADLEEAAAYEEEARIVREFQEKWPELIRPAHRKDRPAFPDEPV